MWPFKKKPVLSVEEWATQFPPAPCGQQTDHYQWLKIERMVCPHCFRAAEIVRKDEHDKKMARLIAENLAELLKEKK